MADLQPNELLSRLQHGEPVTVIDVRSRAEFAAGHVPGALHVPFHQMPWRAGELGDNRGSDVVLYCGLGPRALLAGAVLKWLGFAKVRYLQGHWTAWQEAGLPVERPPTRPSGASP